MADRTLFHPGDGRITTPGPLKVGPDGKIGVGAVEAINLFLASIVNKINGNLNLGSGDHGTWAGNFYWQWIEFTTPSSADAEFEIPHGLDRVAEGWINVFQDAGGVLYGSSVGSWTTNRVFAAHSGTSVLCKILIV